MQGLRRFPPVVLLTDPARFADPRFVLESLPAGSTVILRHYGAPERKALARALAGLTRRKRQRLVVAMDGTDWRTAAEVGAHGLHLPEGLARHGILAPALGWLRRRKRRLSIAAHTPAALSRAHALKANWAVLSPVFATASHPKAHPLGVLRFRQWVRHSGMGIVALGGINAITLRALKGCPLAGIAYGSPPPRNS